jgi:hypothetical protein
VVMKNCEPLPFGPAFYLQVSLLYPGRAQEVRDLTHSHTQQSPFRVLPLEILICESFRPVNTRAPSSIPIDEISSLTHEILDDSMKFTPFVALRSSEMVF